MSKVYDRAYFDHWYRHPDRRNVLNQALKRKVALAVAMAEYHLGRPIRSVLDVGCGEGVWRAPLLALRPKLDYLGVDSSEYVVGRYGRQRNLHWMHFGQMAELCLDEPVDLLVCADVMHFIPTRELKRGLSGFARLCDGVAWIEVFCREDAVEGDHVEYIQRHATWYRKQLTAAGWRGCGSHCYLAPARQDDATALEIY